MFNKDVLAKIEELSNTIIDDRVDKHTIDFQRDQIEEYQRTISEQKSKIESMESVIKAMREQTEKEKEAKACVDEALTSLAEIKEVILGQNRDELLTAKARVDELVYENNNLNRRISDSATTLAEYQEKIDKYIKAYSLLTEQKKKDDDLLENLKDYAKKNNDDTKELQTCLAAVLCGMFDHDHIEFVALKTYRGWKYIYHDGETIDDFGNVGSIDVHYNRNERIEMNVTYEGQ